MGMLYTIQPELEPIEYTHFDTWEYVQKDSIEEMRDCQVREFGEVVTEWEKALGVCLSRPLVRQLGLQSAFDLIIVQLLEGGFDIYNGDEFIEIYKGIYE